ncbi:MAG: 2-amino-4-hydroxy-6-hydroxymethyldihydropteridine diphosphokinase [Planctomycetota bacterium]|jgi:2-amino-4-hydroxy-6-hydroxymethyldihydropteridine diphosphokinase
MTEPITAYIGLGSNLGDRTDNIDKAVKMLTKVLDVEVAHVSNLSETAPLGQTNQPNYLNAVARIKTTLTAEQLHTKTTDIETSLGREKQEKWAPRTIDLDILLFGAEVINQPDLTIPHSQMHLRSFVLNGLCQLNPQLLHPVLKESTGELLARLNGADFVRNPDLPQLISIAGVIGVGKTTLTKKLAEVFGCKTLLEPYDTNPFMPDVYAGKKEVALDSQLYFLTHRVEQLDHNKMTPGRIAVSDYIFEKELIYAKRLLDARQLASYEEKYPSARAKIIAPVLVLYMTDSPQNCLERIHRRNRPYEQKIKLQFLQTLVCDYQKLFSDWKICPVIRIQMSKFDCAKDTDIDHLTNQVKNYVALSEP